MKQKQCYMCSSSRTTDEHIPPKCLFPEKKDSNGLDFRKNLITVPSCDKHNLKKSADDEFLMISLAGLLQSNVIGILHQHTKVNRAIERMKDKDFIFNQVLRNHMNIKLGRMHKTPYNAIIGNPNYDRIVKSFKYITYGLFFHKYNKRFKGKITILMDFLFYSDKNIRSLIELIKKIILMDSNSKNNFEGDNPEVFMYRFLEPDENGLIALIMKFYGSVIVYASFQPAGVTEPFNLAKEFIKGGIHTIVNIDNEKFEFNKKKPNI